MRLTTFLNFELGTACNLGCQHHKCPNTSALRWELLDTSRLMDDNTITACAISAYHEYGFTGLIHWHFYNEPMLQADRMFALMARIRATTPQARFQLWTNGTRTTNEPRLQEFECVVVTDYANLGAEGWQKLIGCNCRALRVVPNRLDERMTLSGSVHYEPCMRPFVEFIIDAYGNQHICCYDWMGRASLGNVYTTGWHELMKRWPAIREAISRGCMTEDAPAACKTCNRRQAELWRFDPEISGRIDEWLRKR